jgi:hypothetical protein
MKYMYRNKNGVSVFTGFVMANDKIIWIGKNERYNRPIDVDNQSDVDFFMENMKQYDK